VVRLGGKSGEKRMSLSKLRYSFHTGPKGGAEFREWTGTDTFRTVSKYAAWPHLSKADKTAADALATTRREKKKAKQANDAAWRNIMRGG